jgi:hypothetical protein
MNGWKAVGLQNRAPRFDSRHGLLAERSVAVAKRGARVIDAYRQRVPGHDLLRTGLLHRPVDRSAAYARHNGGDQLFIINLIGLGLGPLAVGLLSDWFNHGLGLGSAQGVRWALIVSTLFGRVAFAFFWIARKTIREDNIS